MALRIGRLAFPASGRARVWRAPCPPPPATCARAARCPTPATHPPHAPLLAAPPSQPLNPSLAAAHIVVSSSSSLLSAARNAAAATATAAGAAASFHPALAPLSAAAAALRGPAPPPPAATLTRTRRRGPQRRATPIGAKQQAPHAGRAGEFAAAAGHVLSGASLAAAGAAPAVLTHLRDRRGGRAAEAAPSQQAADARRAAEGPWLFSLALQTSLL